MPRRFSLLVLAVASLLAIEAQAKPKVAMAVYHFNLQYVAGDQRIERRIVRESIIPLLDFYEAHPNYKGDFEIQGWALEVIQEEFPQVIERLRALINNGQLELVVAHYSDQLFIGYPAIDLQRSVELSDKVLKKLNLKRSRVFFAQELQWSPALASALQGKYDVVVTSGDPYGYYRSNAMPLEWFEYAGKRMLVLLGGGKKDLKCCRWDWAFFDDGEVFSTRDYMSDFYRVPEWEKQHVDKFKRLENEGYRFVTVTEFVELLKKRGYKIPVIPYLPEGTWNMSAGGPYNWLGKQGGGAETDGPTRARHFQARNWVLTAQTLVKKVIDRLQEPRAFIMKVLELAWQHLLLGEVSDSSGWSPFPIEVRYTDEECTVAEQGARTLIEEILKATHRDTGSVLVDIQTGEVKSATKPACTPQGQVSYPPVPILALGASYSITARKFSDKLYRVEITVTRPEDGQIEIAFPLSGKVHYYSPPLGEDSLVTVPTDLKHDPILSLVNGLFTLGNGWNLIKDNTVEHLAGTWRYKTNELVFREGLRSDVPAAKMAFYLHRGTPEEGLKLANRLNVWPLVRVRLENGQVLLHRLGLEEQ